MSPEALRALVAPFFEEQPDLMVYVLTVYVSKCCERVRVGLESATSCRTCDKVPVSFTLSSIDEIEDISQKI